MKFLFLFLAFAFPAMAAVDSKLMIPKSATAPAVLPPLPAAAVATPPGAMALPAALSRDEAALAARGRFGAGLETIAAIDQRLAVAEQLFRHRDRDNDLEAVSRLSRFVFGELAASSPELQPLQGVIQEAVQDSASRGILSRLRADEAVRVEMGSLTSMDVFGPPKPASALRLFFRRKTTGVSSKKMSAAVEFSHAGAFARELRRISSPRKRLSRLKEVLSEQGPITWDEALVLLAAFRPQDQPKAYKIISPRIATPLNMYPAEGRREIEAEAARLAVRPRKDLPAVGALVAPVAWSVGTAARAAAAGAKKVWMKGRKAAVVAGVIGGFSLGVGYIFTDINRSLEAERAAAAAYVFPDGATLLDKLEVIDTMAYPARAAAVQELATDEALQTMSLEQVVGLVDRMNKFEDNTPLDRDARYDAHDKILMRYVQLRPGMSAPEIRAVAEQAWGQAGEDAINGVILRRPAPKP